ncbi:hypothetical protein N7495_002864 [Penicillium taxi]|uniref:uncharacterized protein n=1 Tax=Penicillium taxi TaxID=168475 RepID=UPI00254520C5|nr:uncharacterized protein N7495_002864 [Penicillium taxi]KAJ5902336.1 hypothetical protein N7495_002864 [Penicillium taxi]
MCQSSNSEIPLEPINHGDQPPLYDVIAFPSFNPVAVDHSIPGGWECTWQDKFGTKTLSPSLSSSPNALYQFISSQLKIPPRQYVHIKGIQSKLRDSVTEIDFDFRLDLTSTLVRLDENANPWYERHVVCDGDDKEVFRGGCCKSLEWSQPLRQHNRYEAIDIEENENREDHTILDMNLDSSDEVDSNLMTWCERYCQDPAKAKSFTFTRSLEGFDTGPLVTELSSYLRSINYRGQVEITTSTHNNFITIYSPHWINYLRNNSFVWWLCFFSQLWIITQIVITFSKSHYEVVHSVWRSSSEVKDTSMPSGFRKVYARGRDETKLADFWAPAVIQAASDQLNGGQTLTEESIQRLQRRAQERLENIKSFLPERSLKGDSTAEVCNAIYVLISPISLLCIFPMSIVTSPAPLTLTPPRFLR